MAGTFTASNDIWRQRERAVAGQVENRVLNSESIEAATAAEVAVRGILPAKDLDSGEDNGWTDDEEWRQDFAGGTADAWNEAYEVNSNGRADDKVIGIYGATVASTTVDARSLRFGIGLDGLQGVHQEANIETIENDQESRGLLYSDVYFGANDQGTIEAWLENATDGQRLVLHGFVGEPVGETVSRPIRPDFGVGRERGGRGRGRGGQ